MPEVRPGDDLARLLLEAVGRAGLELADGDVLAVTSKVVAKAEGRTVPLPEDPAARERVAAETVAAETARVVARRGRLVIAETRTGLVGANALVDASNAGGDRLVLLPADPDASAARLRAAIEELDGHDVAVVVTDTLGRPWRLGQTDVAVGLAGMGALDDWRGRADGDGRLLEVTEVAVADEVAAAADLVKGKASRVPAALLRGVPRPRGDGTARDLVRPPTEDLFRTAGTAEDLLAFLEGPAAPTGAAVDPATLGKALASARAVPIPGGRRLQVVPVPDAPELLACCLGPPADPAATAAGVELAAGGAVRTLVLALHALGAGAVFQPVGPERRWPGRSTSNPAGSPLGCWRPVPSPSGGSPGGSRAGWPGGCGGSRRGSRRPGRWPSRPGTATRSGCRG
jgi:coenzyme F420-0:L-glutamate ligase